MPLNGHCLSSSYVNLFVVTLCDVCVRLFSCKPDYCIIVSPLDKPRCFWGKQLLICLNNKKKKKKKNGVNRLATKGEKILLTTDKTEEEITD